jgi:general secretion pathway protein I
MSNTVSQWARSALHSSRNCKRMNPSPLTLHPSPKGFTLLEVLVALAVVAISMGALWKGLSQGIVVSQGLPDRVVARWVAQNRIVLRQAMEEWPDARSYTGTELMDGREWLWEEQITVTEQAQMRRIVVTVGSADQPALFTLEGYLRQPRPTLNPTVSTTGPSRQADVL